jgi:ABC-type transport system substrate-binding protein
MNPTRRDLLAAGASWTLAARAATAPSPSAPTRKTLRAAFNFAETGFDPAQVSDNASLIVCDLIFESPLTYDPLARPARLVPQTAVALPDVSDDFRRYVFTIRPGILFADDPVFGGRPRELTAADYVYSVKRFYDPAVKTERLYRFENAKLLGLSELRRHALATRTPFPYDVEVPGIRALDRYRFEVRLAAPMPRFEHVFAAVQNGAAMAREAVETYTDDLMAHPVGTGPYRLAQWRRSSKIVLERNPRYREVRFEADAPEGDLQAQAAVAALRGQRLPRLDRIEVSVIEESQPRWLAFVGGELDTIALPPAYAPQALPNDRLAPYLAKRGIWRRRTLSSTVAHTFFNCDDAQVGGYTAARVALRRAIALACDKAGVVGQIYNGQAVQAQSMIPPGNYGFDPALKTHFSDHDPARANALLDVYGYDRRDGEGWRTQPDGSRLELRYATQQDQRSRRLAEMWSRDMQRIGLRLTVEIAPFGELIRRSLAGQLQMWGFSWSEGPDGDFFLGLAYGPNADQSNDARFRLAAFDALYERQRALPDGPERLAVMREAQKLMLAYVPYIPSAHPIDNDLSHAHVRHLIRHPFRSTWWHFTEIGAPSA